MNLNELNYEYAPFALTAPLPEGPVCREPECIRGPYTVPGDDDTLAGLCKAHRDLALHSLQSRARRGEAA